MRCCWTTPSAPPASAACTRLRCHRWGQCKTIHTCFPGVRAHAWSQVHARGRAPAGDMACTPAATWWNLSAASHDRAHAFVVASAAGSLTRWYAAQEVVVQHQHGQVAQMEQVLQGGCRDKPGGISTGVDCRYKQVGSAFASLYKRLQMLSPPKDAVVSPTPPHLWQVVELVVCQHQLPQRPARYHGHLGPRPAGASPAQAKRGRSRTLPSCFDRSYRQWSVQHLAGSEHCAPAAWRSPAKKLLPRSHLCRQAVKAALCQVNPRAVGVQQPRRREVAVNVCQAPVRLPQRVAAQRERREPRHGPQLKRQLLRRKAAGNEEREQSERQHVSRLAHPKPASSSFERIQPHAQQQPRNCCSP